MLRHKLMLLRSQVGLDIYVPPLTGKPDQQRLKFEVAY